MDMEKHFDLDVKKSKVTFFTIRKDPKPVDNLFIYSCLSNHRYKTHKSVTMTVGGDTKIRTALRSHWIAGFLQYCVVSK